ncbi:hypothetical protein ACQUW5_03615 [Legionella sp. CNM-1927-20]|uniref:hypothetical protein n=1 Tax=Legionella sp. CNM-1927-20 TaxID=3422221 RepID=UPI00403AEFA6
MANTAKILAALNKDNVIAEVDVNQQPLAGNNIKQSTPHVSSSQDMAKIVEGIGRSFDPRKGDPNLTPFS